MGNWMIALILAAVVSLSVAPRVTAVDNPTGLEITWQDTLFAELSAAITPVVENIFLNADIPQINGSINIIWPVGTFDYWISNVDFSQADFSQNAFITLANAGVQFTVNDGNAQFTCNWKWKRESGLLHFSDSGTVTVIVEGIDITLQASLSADDDGHPVVHTLEKPSIKFDHLKFDVHSPLTGWIYDIFLWLFNFIIKDVIEDQMEDIVENIINNNVNEILQEIPTVIPLGPVAFNASLENSVVFTSTFLTLPFVGGFQSKNNNIPIPFTSGDLPDYCNDEMINILIDEYMFDSLAYILYEEGLLNITLNPSDLPPEIDSTLLNTTYWKAIIPNLDQNYPESLMDMVLTPMDVPNLNFTTSGLDGQSIYQISYSIANGSAIPPPVLVLSADFVSEFSVAVNQTANSTVLRVHVSKLKATLDVITSDVGHVDVDLLNAGISTLIDTVIKPLLNSILNDNGIPLPSLNIFHLEQPEVTYYNGYTCITSDVNVIL